MTLSDSFPYVESLWKCIVLSLVVSSTSYTITITDIFEPIRNLLAKKSYWLGKLFSCFHCLSHWITFVLVAIYQPQIIPGDNSFINFAVSAFFIIQMATYFTGLVFKSIGVVLPVKAQLLAAKANEQKQRMIEVQSGQIVDLK